MLLRLAYDGTDFHGFARQPGVRTVQGELERVLAGIYGDEILTRGASRTDAGVHARGQVVAFEPTQAIPPEGLCKALQGHCPADLVVSAAWMERGKGGAPVEPRFVNDGKHYRYRIRTGPLRDPFEDRVAWLYRGSLDAERMRDAAQRLVGEHDYRSFRASGCQATTTVRRILSIEIEEGPVALGVAGDPVTLSKQPRARRLDVHVRGTAFLKYMVRIMVGTLAEVGAGRREPPWIDELLATPDRAKAGPTAPPQGLTLEEVFWPRGAPADQEG